MGELSICVWAIVTMLAFAKNPAAGMVSFAVFVHFILRGPLAQTNSEVTRKPRASE